MTMDNLEGYVQSLSIALMNGLWQGGILVLVYIGVARWIPWMSASARHNLGMMTLIAMVCIHCAHLIQPHHHSAPDATEAIDSGAPERAEHIWQADYIVSGTGAFMPRKMVPDSAGNPGVNTADSADGLPPEVIIGGEYSETNRGAGPPGSLGRTWWASLAGQLESMSRHIQWNLQIPLVVHVLIVVCALIFSIYRSLIFIVQLRHILRIKNSAELANPGIESLFQTILSDHPRHRPVSLRVSTQVSSPLVIGFRHPKILLPQVLNDEATDIKAMQCILHHELAHVERWDDWANLLQQCLVSLMHFNPILAWLSTRLTVDREMACDEQAVKKSKARMTMLWRSLNLP